MTVRTWFRLLRASDWEHGPACSDIAVRHENPPWEHAEFIRAFHFDHFDDLVRFVNAGPDRCLTNHERKVQMVQNLLDRALDRAANTPGLLNQLTAPADPHRYTFWRGLR